MTTESSRQRWRRIAFDTDTPAGQRVDKLLILAIIASVLLVMLDSEPAVHARYGDIAPQTPLGPAIASMAMITGYSIIAVPTGIITAEIATSFGQTRYHRECSGCSLTAHDEDAVFCKHCGTDLRDAS